MKDNTRQHEGTDPATGNPVPATREDQKGRLNRDNRGNRVQESD